MIIQTAYLVRQPELKELTIDGRQTYKMDNAISFYAGTDNNTIIDIQIWGNNAKFVADRFEKGDPIQIAGDLRMEKYTAKDGTEKKRYYIYVEKVQFVPRKKDMSSAVYSASAQDSAPVQDSAPAQETDVPSDPEDLSEYEPV